MQKILALICVVIIVSAGALIIVKGTEGYDMTVGDISVGESTTITFNNAVFSQERLNGDHEVRIEVAGVVYEDTLTFNNGQASMSGIGPMNEVGRFEVKVTINDHLKRGSLNVFLYMVTDDRGKEVGFFDYPQTIVSLGKAFTEMLFELDSGEKLIASDSYSIGLKDEDPNNYSSLNDIHNLGALSSSWDSEFIAGLNPDLVIIHRYTWGAYPQLISHLEGFNIKVVAYYPSSYDAVVDLVGRFGILLNETAAADQLQTYMTDVKAEAIAKTASIADDDKPKVYAELRNLRTVNNGSLMHELITTAGGKNVAQNASAGSTYFADVESPIALQPTIIILESAHPKSSEQYRADFGVPGDVNIHRFTATYLNYSPSLAKGMIEMAETLHPGIDFDWPSK